ncbi:hypothetical protein Gohar_027478, partial [Gossypium harknessii]|nr:hypothetical protein [Gossypium harknessii]
FPYRSFVLTNELLQSQAYIWNPFFFQLPNHNKPMTITKLGAALSMLNPAKAHSLCTFSSLWLLCTIEARQ